MSRIGILFAMLIAGTVIIPNPSTFAQSVTPTPKSTTAVPADLDAKIKKSVVERAQKRKQAAEDRKMKQKKLADCKKQAKVQKLSSSKGRAFVNECMTK